MNICHVYIDCLKSKNKSLKLAKGTHLTYLPLVFR